MNRYYLHIPGEVYAITVYGCRKREALNQYKHNANIDRMPNGYSIWLDGE